MVKLTRFINTVTLNFVSIELNMLYFMNTIISTIPPICYYGDINLVKTRLNIRK